MVKQLLIRKHRPRGANEREKKMAKKTLKKAKKLNATKSLMTRP
jgi:hypothetical protein